MRFNRRQWLHMAGGAGALSVLGPSKANAAQDVTVEQLEQAAAAPGSQETLVQVSRCDRFRRTAAERPRNLHACEIERRSGRNLRHQWSSAAVASHLQSTRCSLLPRQGCARPGDPLVGSLSAQQQLQAAEPGALVPGRVGGNWPCSICWAASPIKSIGQLLGEMVRDEVAYYIASGNRDTTPEEEVKYLARLVEENRGQGGQVPRRRPHEPPTLIRCLGAPRNLIPLSRKALGDDIDIHADSNSSYDPPAGHRSGQDAPGH